MKRDVEEAQSELLDMSLLSTPVICGIGSRRRKAAEVEAYDDAVDCLNRLAQHLAALTSETEIQAELTRTVGGEGRSSEELRRGLGLREVAEENESGGAKGKGNERGRSEEERERKRRGGGKRDVGSCGVNVW
ncbi:hypothetical protein M422DRAFT_32676 [Sphaerobolus stellatus SS14]|uniref:Uncharacterized protein n=1 Tax=Sphaerobolus stellatus (strain SS14) TaxID=990650 RepID=A0A0C9VN65_SPHS4|nr:hypothetical protein M422DRAFT_32676 [Sphaerobolus stellatus SS14]